MKKDLTQISDLTVNDVAMIIKKSFEFKEAPPIHEMGGALQGKAVAIILEKPSLRTRVAFEVATHYFGAIPIILTSKQILSSGQNETGRESISDIAKSLERFCDLIIVRTYSHATIQQIAANTTKSVINALCDQHHPTQALADLMTIIWHKKQHQGLKIAFIGDGNNVATSLLDIAALTGINFSIASP